MTKRPLWGISREPFFQWSHGAHQISLLPPLPPSLQFSFSETRVIEGGGRPLLQALLAASGMFLKPAQTG